MTVTLVTGGAGFIGSHLVDALLERGERVRVLDSLDPLAHPGGRVPEHLDSEAELLVGDLREPETVERAMTGVEAVYHLGGSVGNGESMMNVRRTVEANAVGTATLLESALARRDRLKRLVAASSMVVYGEGAYRCSEHGETPPAPRTPERLRLRQWEPPCPHCGRELSAVPVPEDWPLRPMSVYGISKRDQEELCLVLGGAYGLETVALRFLNTYGPRQALGNPYTGVAAIFAARLLVGRRPLVFEDGGQLRDLIHVSDVVRAVLAAMDSPAAAGHAINVGTGRRTQILDLATDVARALGSDLEPEVTGEFRAGDIRHCVASARRAHELLGFEASVRLDEGLPALAEWVAGQTVEERGDEALADLRARNLVG